VSTGYISSLSARREALSPPGRQPSRLAELGALLAWIVGSWLRAADGEAAWEQQAGHEARLP
jgi:hypothetical protein